MKSAEVHAEDYSGQVTGRKLGNTQYPVYDSAVTGFMEYWYPVLFSKKLQEGKSLGLKLLGQKIALFRNQGKVFALENRCVHRGVPLAGSSCDFAGTVSCPYHGWVYNLESGKVVAALTDGPDSKIAKAKLGVRTYAVEERAGVVFVFIGNSTPPPLAEDVPEEFLEDDAVVIGRVTERPGDWRHAAENGYDEGHVKYLHRRGVWTFWRRAPAWGFSEKVEEEGSKWLTREVQEVGFGGEYAGLGYWPKKNFWRWRPGARGIRIRLPGTLRIQYKNWAHYEWYVPTSEGNHRYLQFIVKRTNSLGGLWLKIKYFFYIKPFFHKQFNDQDAWMVEEMQTPPEILYRPDRSIISWRRFVEKNNRKSVAELREDGK